MASELTQWLTQELDKRKWKHKDLAENTGLSRPLVTQVIGGKMSPSCEFCVKVALAFNQSPEYTLSLAGIIPTQKEPDDKTTKELLAIFQTLSPAQQDQVLEYVKFISR